MRVRAAAAGLIALGVSAAIGITTAPSAAANPSSGFGWPFCSRAVISLEPFVTSWVFYGDVNRDFRVTSYDAYLASQLASSGGNDPCADVDQSGDVTTRDVYLIQQAVVGLVRLPVT